MTDVVVHRNILVWRCSATLAKRSTTIRGDKYINDKLIIYVPQSISRSNNPYAWIPDIDCAAFVEIDLWESPDDAATWIHLVKTKKKGCYKSLQPVGVFRESIHLALSNDTVLDDMYLNIYVFGRI